MPPVSSHSIPEARGYNVARTLAKALTCPRHGLNYVDACPSCLEEAERSSLSPTPPKEMVPPQPGTPLPVVATQPATPPARPHRTRMSDVTGATPPRSLKAPPNPVDQLENSIAWLELD